MSVQEVAAADAIARLDDFGAIIDARSEAEYELDHLPGALNWPSLEQRRAQDHRHDLHAGQPVRGAKARRGAGGGQHRAPHRARGDRQAPQLAAAGLLLARRQAQRLAGPGAGRDRLSRQRARGRLQGLPHCRAGGAARAGGEPPLPRRLRAHRLRQDAAVAGAGAARAPRCWTWRRWPATAAPCWARSPVSRSPRKSASTRWCGTSCAGSIRPVRSSSRAKAGRSATWPCPTR